MASDPRPISGASLGLAAPSEDPRERLAFERHEVQRYVEGGLIGRGGMGEIRSVYDARLGRVVARKSPVVDDHRAVEQLVAEATLTARLVHPNIVPIHDAGCTSDGRPFYTMPIVQGRSLADAIAERSSMTERLRLVRHFLDACEAIAYAHSQAVLHRDLKPGNILVGRFGETLVVDWGLAGPVGVRPPGIIGTPGYMAPEQRRGQPLSPSADVFALGVTLRELVTGSRNGQFEPGTPPELQAIVDRATDPSPTRRYVDGRALAADVGAWFEGRRVAAYRYGLGDLLARAWAQHRVPLLIALLALLSIAVAITIGAWRTSIERARAQESERVALMALSRAEQNLAKAEVAQALGAATHHGWAEAELLAAGALTYGPSPAARGVLARFDSAARPRLLRRSTVELDDSSDHESAWITGTTEHWAHAGFCESTHWCEALGHGAPGAVAVQADDSRVIACQDGGVLIWRADSGVRELLQLPASLGGPLVLARSSDEPRYAALGLASGSAVVIDLDEARIVQTFASDGGTPFDLALASSRLALSDGGSVYVWELDSGALIVRLAAPIARVRWLDDGQTLRVIGTSTDDWALPASRVRPHVRSTGVGIAALSLSPDGRFVITAHGDGRVRLGRLDHTDTQVEIPLHSSVVKDVEFSPDGARAVAICAQDKRLHLIDLADPSRVQTVASETGSRVAWLRDTVQLAPYVGGIQGLGDGDLELTRMSELDGRVIDMHSDSNREGASAITQEGGVWRLSARPGAPARLIAERPGAMAIAGDAEQILIASDTELERIDADGRSQRVVLAGSRVTELALSTDGRLLAVGHHDGSLHLLATATLEPLAVLHGHTGLVSALAFDQAGEYLVSGSWDGDVRQWSLRALELPADAVLAEAERDWGLTLDELLRTRALTPM